jgi:hypothetical protein
MRTFGTFRTIGSAPIYQTQQTIRQANVVYAEADHPTFIKVRLSSNDTAQPARQANVVYRRENSTQHNNMTGYLDPIRRREMSPSI